jgi:hypothetical protein
MKISDRKLRMLLADLITRIKEHGSRSNEVAEFVRTHYEVDEFPELAYTCVFMAEKMPAEFGMLRS